MSRPRRLCVPSSSVRHGPVVNDAARSPFKDRLMMTTAIGVLAVRPRYQPSRLVILASAPPALMLTFTASSMGSLKGTSIRSNPFK